MISINRAVYILLAIILTMTICLPCSARTTDELEVNWSADGALTGTTGAMWLTFELLKDEIAPKKCIWCQTNDMDESITDALSWPTPAHAARTADIMAFGAIPALSISSLLLSSGLDGRIQNSGADLLLLAEAITLSSLANQFVKFSVGRARPFTVRNHHNMYKDRADDNLSFYSGHTNMVFAVVVSAGMIAHYRYYDAEPYIWGIGIPAALFVAYTRVAAEKHYFTDVLIGAAIGSAIGFLVPWLHKNNNKSPSKTLSPQTLSLRLSGNILTMSGVF